MSRIPPFPPGTVERMQRIMLTATRAKELRHAQCVYLAASADWSIRQIAALTGLTEKTVSIILSNFRIHGEAAILCDDLGYARRHAALSLSDEKQFLARLAAEHAQGRSITAAYAWSALQDRFGEACPKSLVYSLFYRHGWTATGKQGHVEGTFIPPSPAADDPQQAARSPGSHYVPRTPHPSPRSPLPSRRATLLSADQELAVLAALEAQLKQHQAVTVKDGQCAVEARCQVRFSRQTMRRLFVRHGWRQLRRGGLAMWVCGDGFSEAELWNGLFDRHQTRRLSTADERGIAQFLEHALQRGEQVTARMAQDALQSQLGIAVSRNAAVKFLLRNGWRPVNSNGHIWWVSGHAANETGENNSTRSS